SPARSLPRAGEWHGLNQSRSNLLSGKKASPDYRQTIPNADRCLSERRTVVSERARDNAVPLSRQRVKYFDGPFLRRILPIMTPRRTERTDSSPSSKPPCTLCVGRRSETSARCRARGT